MYNKYFHLLFRLTSNFSFTKMNFTLEWVYGKLNIDATEMNNAIELYLNNRIEPSYNQLYYDDIVKGRIYYEYDECLTIIKQKRELLEEQLQTLDNFEYLVIKNGYADKYEAYLTKLFTEKKSQFYKVMNEECECIRNLEAEWNETHCNLSLVLCERCRFYLHISNGKQ